jgi:hypothetical protein
MTCHDPETVCAGRDGQPVAGLANIKKSLERLCDMAPPLRGTSH